MLLTGCLQRWLCEFWVNCPRSDWDMRFYSPMDISKHIHLTNSLFYGFFQAILFYVPRWLWKNWEAGKVAALRMDLNLGIISEVEKKLKKKLLIEYMYSNLKHHNFWAYRYFFCELLALINVGGKHIYTLPNGICNSHLDDRVFQKYNLNFLVLGIV